MKRRSLVNITEARTLDLLDRALHGTAWQVFVKPRLADVIVREDGDSLDSDSQRLLMMGHLDFLIVRREDRTPVFAVEFDGPTHSDPASAARDRRKDELCARAGLPLLRISGEAIGEREQTTILEWVIARFVAFQIEYPRILSRCNATIDELNDMLSRNGPYDEEDAEYADSILGPDDGPLDPSIDPDFQFDARYPFPAIATIVRRLFAKYGIVAIGPATWGVLSLGPPEDPGIRLIVDERVRLIRVTGWHQGDWIFGTSSREAIPEGEVLCDFERHVDVTPAMRHDAGGWTPVDTNRTAVAQVLGTTIWDIDRALGTYLALVDVERWCAGHLRGP